jgi:Protein of unknown function (DUF3237)
VVKAPEPLELVPLARMVATLREPFSLAGTPSGTRLIFEVEDARIEGERLQGRLAGRAAADWLTVGPDGTGSLDVRSLLRTHDGALVFVHYTGRVDMTARGAHVYATPRFDSGDERYMWLNRIQAVGKGLLDGSTLTYDLFELR